MLHSVDIAEHHGVFLTAHFKNDLRIGEANLLFGGGHHNGPLETADAKIPHVFLIKAQGLSFAICCQQGSAYYTRKDFLAVGIAQIKG